MTVVVTYPRWQARDPAFVGKFLQVSFRGCDHLLFASASEHRYHNQLLARFLSDQSIPHRWRDTQHLVLTDPGLVVLGGGRFHLDPAAETLRVWDESSVYGRFDAGQLTRQLAGAGAPWDRLELCIE